jgi:hypothetical protein
MQGLTEQLEGSFSDSMQQVARHTCRASLCFRLLYIFFCFQAQGCCYLHVRRLHTYLDMSLHACMHT